MRTFWKVLLIALMVIYFAGCLAAFSMSWWPDMPTSPRPDEGRIYPLNKHGRYTYMNPWEYRLNSTISISWPFLVAALCLIIHIPLMKSESDDTVLRLRSFIDQNCPNLHQRATTFSISAFNSS